MTVGENIKKFRLEKSMTQKELGEMCGLADSAIRRYELGGANPKMETLHKIAKALDKSIILLVEGCEDKYPLSETLLEKLKPDEKTTTLDIRENKILSDFRQLNNIGKMEAIKRVEELNEIPRYTAEEKESLNNYCEFVKDKPQEYWDNFKEQLDVIDKLDNEE